jgi:hypothetical protein
MWSRSACAVDFKKVQSVAEVSHSGVWADRLRLGTIWRSFRGGSAEVSLVWLLRSFPFMWSLAVVTLSQVGRHWLHSVRCRLIFHAANANTDRDAFQFLRKNIEIRHLLRSSSCQQIIYDQTYSESSLCGIIYALTSSLSGPVVRTNVMSAGHRSCGFFCWRHPQV